MIPELLKYAIGQSDNITAVKMFTVEGGPSAVNTYVHEKGISEISIVTDYAHMGEDSLHRNWGSPWAIVQLLAKFQKEHLLSDSSYALLWKTMVEGPSGANRLKGKLPTGTVVAHKTGTSGTNDSTGITAAINDAGIVVLPNGKHYAIAVFVANSKEPEADNAGIIADISKLVWDYFVGKGNSN
jgi:beta-lactamase class A